MAVMSMGMGMDLDASLPSRRVPWWVYLITATAWLVIAWVVLRFDLRTVRSIGILAGVVMLLAAAAELFNMVTAPGWKWLHGILGGLFLITGFVAFMHPGNTFVWMSAFIGWYLLFKGFADIFLSFATKDMNDAWWLTLIVGIIEVGIGFWAAGHFARSAYILVLYVGVIALTRAIVDVTIAFRLRKIQHAANVSPISAGPSHASGRTVLN
jgi:uncharacterized membrane protein HdeD (DUF308 family)